MAALVRPGRCRSRTWSGCFSRELREAAFERFRITLILDQRYNLLALITARYSMDDPELLARGIDVFLLRSFAAEAWPAGFPPDLSEDAFEALLDEMVGLGLLRQVNSSYYALRSANLARLIGTPAEIKRQIDAFATRIAPQEPDPLELRRSIDGWPSLLTARQEAEILAPRSCALVLAGIDLAGIGNASKAIAEAVANARARRALQVQRTDRRSPSNLGTI